MSDYPSNAGSFDETGARATKAKLKPCLDCGSLIKGHAKRCKPCSGKSKSDRT